MNGTPGFATRVAVVVVCALSLNIGCPSTPTRTETQTDPPAQAQEVEPPAFVEAISSETVWSDLAVSRSGTFLVEVVKFAIDLRDERRLYFADGHRYPMHFDFALEHLAEGRVVARELSSGEPFRWIDQDLVIGFLYLNAAAEVPEARWTVRFYGGDSETAAGIVETFEQIAEQVFFGDVLRFVVPNRVPSSEVTALQAYGIPVISDSVSWNSETYQLINTGTGYGYLRVLDASETVDARPNEILVTRDVPDELPMVAGIITSEPQTPLAHIAVLSQSRGTPNMSLRGADGVALIASLEGQLVRLEVQSDSFQLEPTSLEEAEAAWALSRPEPQPVPPPSFEEVDLLDLASLSREDVRVVGAKAAQLGEVTRIHPPILVPVGFVIPFAHYAAHLRSHRLDTALDATLEDATFQSDGRERSTRLASFRLQIEEADVDARLLAAVRTELGRFDSDQVILRSSTNSEDLQRFSGAGLYRSVIIARDAQDAELGLAIAEVWSSVWLDRAYEERDWYGIPHTDVAMAILVQPLVGDLVANGVAITVNPFDAQTRGFYINAGDRSGSVTAGTGHAEQILVTITASEVLHVERLGRATPVLTEDDMARLIVYLRQLHEHFVPTYSGAADAVDIEFLVDSEHNVWIVQARPYQSRL